MEIRTDSSGRSGDQWLRGRAWGVALAALALCSVLTTMLGNGASRGLDRSETYVARVPTEMARRAAAGEPSAWIVPYYNGEVRLQKPPINYVLTGAAHAALDEEGSDIVSEFSARLPSAAGGVALAFLAVWMGVAAFGDRRVGLLAGAMLATSVGFFTESHHGRPEMVYATFCGLMTAGFVQSMRAAQAARPTRWWGLVAWLGFAGACLTKGPHMPLLMAAGFAGALLVRDRSLVLKTLRPFSGLTLTLVIAGAWFLLVYRAVPEAIEFWFGEIFQRTGWIDPDAAVENKGNSWWENLLSFYYVINLVKATAPWFILIPGAVITGLRRPGAEGARSLSLLLAAAAPILVLSFSSFMRAQYLAPVLAPIFALMAADAVAFIDRWLQEPTGRRKLGAVHVVQAMVVIGACVVAAWLVLSEGVRFAGAPGALAVSVGAAGLGASAVVWGMVVARRRPWGAVASLPAGMALAFVSFSVSGHAWSENRRARVQFAKAVAAEIPRELPMVCFPGDPAVAVYYADRVIPRLRTKDRFLDALRENPDVLVMTRGKGPAEFGFTGEVVLEEPLGEADRMMVLRNVRLLEDDAARPAQ